MWVFENAWVTCAKRSIPTKSYLPIKMFHNSFAVLNHRIIIQIGIRKSLVICTNQLDDGLLLKELKYFEVMLNIFEFWQV